MYSLRAWIETACYPSFSWYQDNIDRWRATADSRSIADILKELGY